MLDWANGRCRAGVILLRPTTAQMCFKKTNLMSYWVRSYSHLFRCLKVRQLYCRRLTKTSYLHNANFSGAKKNSHIFSFVAAHFSDDPVALKAVSLALKIQELSQFIKEQYYRKKSSKAPNLEMSDFHRTAMICNSIFIDHVTHTPTWFAVSCGMAF